MKPLLEMNRRELIAVGFRPWGESGLMLIPDEVFSKVPDGTELLSITGDKKIKGKDKIDRNTRRGLLAFGWIVK